MGLHRPAEPIRKNGHPFVQTFALTDSDLAVAKIHVFHPQPKAAGLARRASCVTADFEIGGESWPANYANER
jgi:hypothetical protein